MYRAIEHSGLFDARWYRTHNRRATVWKDPLWHYLDSGWREGRDPSPFFDTSHYVERYADVRSSGLNPLFHFVEHGRDEDRLPLRFLPQALEALYPDARELPTFVAPHHGTARITVLIDQATIRRSDVPLPEILDLCAQQARDQKKALRVISLLSDPKALFDAVSDTFTGESDVDVVFTAPHAPSTHYPVHEGEVFVATSWTSAFALHKTAPDANLTAITPASKPVIGEMPPGAWRTWALLDVPLVSKLDAAPAGQRVNPEGDSIRLHIAGAATTAPLHALLVLMELENLSLTLAGQGLGTQVSLSGLDLEPLSLVGGVVSMVSPTEVLSGKHEVDCVLDLGVNEGLAHSLAAKAIPIVSALSLLGRPGELSAYLESLLPLEARTP